MEEPLFSLVLLVRGGRHLVPATLDTLMSQTRKDFEILLLDGEGTGRLLSTIGSYPELSIHLLDASAKNLAEMMNLGLEQAKGTYIQFLESGDRYLSQHGLSHLAELIREKKTPSLIYPLYLQRLPNKSPEAINFTFTQELLQKGNIIQSPWILRRTISEMGGFDPRLSQRPIFDFLCRYFLKEGPKCATTRHVLLDSELRRTEVLHFANETCKILYRHFGLKSALKWIFVQDHFEWIRWAALFIKQAFWKKPT